MAGERWGRAPGGPRKKDSEKAVPRNITMEPENDRYILELLNKKGQAVGGNYSRAINEIVVKDRKNALFKAREASALLKRLEELGVDVSQVYV